MRQHRRSASVLSPSIPDEVRKETPSFDHYFGLVVSNSDHVTGLGWARCSHAAMIAHDDDLASLGEWADLTLALLGRREA